MIGATLNMVTLVGLPKLFGTPKYGGLKINSLPSKIVSATETPYKMASRLCQKRVLKELG